MKQIRSLLLTAALWVALLAMASSTAGAYTVTFPPGAFTLFVNHHAPIFIQSMLLGAPPESQILTSNHPFQPTAGDIYFSDGASWVLADGITPAIRTFATGEGMWVYIPEGPPFSINISGPDPQVEQLSYPNDFPPGFIVPGWHIRGGQGTAASQVSDPPAAGTFESTFGRSPKDYDFVQVYRFNSSPVAHWEPTFQFSGTGNNAKWSPSAPILDNGPAEAAFFKLGSFFTLGSQVGQGNTQYFVPQSSGFTLTGVTPNEGTLGGAVALRVTGTGFNGNEQVRLMPMGGGGPPTSWKPASLLDPRGYLIQVLFSASDLAPLTPGLYKVRVQKTGPHQDLDYVFRVNGPTPSLKLTLTGPTLAKDGTLTPGYNLCVENTTGSTIQFKISAELPAGMVIGSLPSGAVPVGTGFEVTSPSFTVLPLGPYEKRCYPFTLTPSLSSLPTVDLVGKILVLNIAQTEVRLPVKVVNSLDPNDKSGPLGFGAGHYITGLDASDYLIRFENKPSATAPAQRVEIVDQLDTTRFDLPTFELGPIGFGPKVVIPPAGLKSWTTDVPYDVDGNPSTLDDNIVVRIEAALDGNPSSPTFAQVKWTFRSLESTPPNLPVALANIGFLPANVTAPEGQGSVSFRVTPFSNIGSGRTIDNQASIVFDNNTNILTGIWVNTIDLDAPSSSVSVLPASQTTASFTVDWSGTDPDSGIASYDIHVSDNNGPYTKWQTATTATSALFNGQVNHAYRFYSVAVDNVGNLEEEPESPDSETTVTVPTVSYTITLPPGFSVISNPLDHGGNTLQEILPVVPVETQILKWDCVTQAYTLVTFDGSDWIAGDGVSSSTMTLTPGEGALIFNSDVSTLTLTFTGTPHLPVLPPPSGCGCGQTNLLSLQAAGIGTFENITGEPPREGSRVERFVKETQNYASYTFSGGTWDPSEPIVNLGEAAFFYTPCVPTNCLTLQCASNLVVECGMTWSFTTPTALETCCGSNATVNVLSTVTNGVCPSIITRTWLATNTCGQTAECSQTVTIVDTTPPQIFCPSNIVVIAATNLEVAYTVTATDLCSGDVPVVCTPPSGTAFAAGTTNLVTCVAVDACGNSNTCAFTVTVIKGYGDLYIQDTPYYYNGLPDAGDEPADANMSSQYMWASRGLWVHEDCLQPPGDFQTHQNPRAFQQNCVFAEVKNRGNLPVAGAKVELWFANASLGLSWPAQWKLIGTYTLPTMNPGEQHIAQAPWTPPETGHFCLIARIVSAVDPLAVTDSSDIHGYVRGNNNIAWRNVNVADCLTTPGRKVEVRVRNFLPAPKLLTLIFTADQDFLPDGGEAILHPGGPLFDRWQAAGARGVNVVVTNGNELRFTGSPARFEGIPFYENEERIFNLTLRADQPMPVPGSSHVYHASLQQELDGQIVGGVDYVLVTRALETDTDHDGVPDVTDPDDDGDGVADTEDTSPMGESDCPLAAISINRVGDDVCLTWSGLGYRLQGTADFSQWDDLAGVTSPATLRANLPYRFFRLICQ